jgi:uncharacterized integral membrane protein
MRFFVWLLRAFIFFTLFAFALNNQHKATVQWFFGVSWTAPMVIVVLAAFATGCAIGVLAMLPGRWRRRAAADGTASAAATAPPASPGPPAGTALEHPPRDGI